MTIIFPATAVLLSRLREHSEVPGACLVGSKSRGHDDARSDDDVDVFLTTDAHAQLSPSACMEQYYEAGKLMYDVRYLCLATMQQKQGSPYDSDHWPYENAHVLFDRDGTIQRTVQLLGCMDAEFRRKRILYSTLSTTIAIGKAFKAVQRGYEAAGRMTVTRGVKALSRLLFALEWRWAPTDHWLEKEMQTLKDPAQVRLLLLETLLTGNPSLLRKAIEQLEHMFPNDVPDRLQRAHLYAEMMHPMRSEERVLSTAFSPVPCMAGNLTWRPGVVSPLMGIGS